MEKRFVLVGAVALVIVAVVVFACRNEERTTGGPSPSTPARDGPDVAEPVWDEPVEGAPPPGGEPADLIGFEPPRAEVREVERFLAVEAPSRVAERRRFPVLVSLTEDGPDPSTELVFGATTPEGRLVLPTGEVHVVLAAPAFDIEEALQTMTVTSRGDSGPLLFALEARPIDVPSLDARLNVSLWKEGTRVASAIRRVTIVRDAPAEAPRRGVSTPIAAERTRAPVETARRAADLTLELWTEGGRPGHATVTVASPYRQTPRHEVWALEDLHAWLETRVGRAARGLRGIATDAAAAAPSGAGNALADWQGLGRELYRRLAPAAFQQMLWDLTDERAVQTVQIHTDVPWIPWELMVPCRPDGSEERGFLGAELAVGRWHISERTALLARPPQSTRVDELVVIAPRYSGAELLPAQEEELGGLRRIARVREVQGQSTALAVLFADVPQALLHFAGHGVVAAGETGVPSYSIVLEDGSLDLTTWLGLAPPRFATHPFLFFNSCDVGRSERVGSFVEGWAPAALERGACGYVGSILPLVDTEAAAFALEFYRQLYGPERGRVADALRATRRAFLERGDPVGLAYVFYGDPNLVLEL